MIEGPVWSLLLLSGVRPNVLQAFRQIPPDPEVHLAWSGFPGSEQSDSCPHPDYNDHDADPETGLPLSAPSAAMPAMIDDPRLPRLHGGWDERSFDLGWTSISLAVPVDPDSLLADEDVLEASRTDDYMPYWASLWPAASQMAGVLSEADWSPGTPVLELGCGLGLVGIAGLRRGWDVLMTDYEPQAVSAAALNAERNGYPGVRTQVLDWRNPPASEWPLVLACDVLYESRNHEPLLAALVRLVAAGGCCWLGDPGRTPVIAFYQAAIEAGFDTRVLSETGEAQSFPVRGQFQVLELRRRVGA